MANESNDLDILEIYDGDKFIGAMPDVTPRNMQIFLMKFNELSAKINLMSEEIETLRLRTSPYVNGRGIN